MLTHTAQQTGREDIYALFFTKINLWSEKETYLNIKWKPQERGHLRCFIYFGTNSKSSRSLYAFTITKPSDRKVLEDPGNATLYLCCHKNTGQQKDLKKVEVYWTILHLQLDQNTWKYSICYSLLEIDYAQTEGSQSHSSYFSSLPSFQHEFPSMPLWWAFFSPFFVSLPCDGGDTLTYTWPSFPWFSLTAWHKKKEISN